MKLPQNSRNISRNFMDYYFWMRLITIGLISGVFLTVILKSQYQILSEQIDKVNRSSEKLANANRYVISASKLINEFNQSQNPQKLNLAKEELEMALTVSPQNTYVQKQLLIVNKLETPYIQEEIAKTQEILKIRPDYSAAWLRLSVLYEQLGEKDLAKEAKENTIRFNSNL